MSDPQRPRGLQPSRLLRPWDFPGKSIGVGCHCFLLQAPSTLILPDQFPSPLLSLHLHPSSPGHLPLLPTGFPASPPSTSTHSPQRSRILDQVPFLCCLQPLSVTHHPQNEIHASLYWGWKLRLSVHQWWIEFQRESFGGSRKGQLYCFARQRGSQQANTLKTMCPNLGKRVRSFMAIVQRGMDIVDILLMCCGELVGISIIKLQVQLVRGLHDCQPLITK